MSSNWSDLHIDILYLIFEKLINNNIKYLSNCAGVCCSWRFANNQLIKKLSPVILLADQGIERDNDQDGDFNSTPPNQGQYCLFNTRTRKTKETMLPELSGRRFYSAWPGWLFTTNCTSPHEISLLNPLTKAQITLPCSWYQGYCAEIFLNVVLSSSPLDSNCIFLGICGDKIGFCRLGDEAWSRTTPIDNSGKKILVLDAIYHKGAFYIVGSSCYDNRRYYMYRVRVDETTMTLTVKELDFFPKLDGGGHRTYYLLELMGELLLLQWLRQDETNTSKRMMIYKLQAVNRDEGRWVRVGSLGKHAIYAGRFHSLSIYVGDGTVHEECRRPNCVYFIDQFFREKDNNGVYDFETDCFEELAFPGTSPLNWFGFQ